MTRYIVTTYSGSEYEVWDEGGYWKVNFNGKERFIAMLVSADGSQFVHFDEINKNKLLGKIIIVNRNNKVPAFNVQERMGLERGWKVGLYPKTSMVKAIKEMK